MYQQMNYLLLEESINFTLKFTLILLQHVSVLDHRQGAYSCALLKLYYVKIDKSIKTIYVVNVYWFYQLQHNITLARRRCMLPEDGQEPKHVVAELIEF
jgi:hypothetical protein